MIDKQQGQTTLKIEDFDALGLKENVLRGIYAYGMEKPSALQSQIIPSICKGRDVIVQAKSGTGKTTTFVISILQLLNLEVKECQALIIAPTYVLAKNIQLLMMCLGDFMSVVVDVSKADENQELQKGTQVFIGSPAKVNSMIQKGSLKVEHLKICVLDEIDEIFSRGFKGQIQEIFERLPKAIQTVMASAKMESEVEAFIKDFTQDPEKILSQEKEMTLDDIKQFYVFVEKDEWKTEVLLDLLHTIEPRKCLVYCNKRKTALELGEKLREKAYNTSEINNEMDERQRVATLEDFKNGALTILLVAGNLTRDSDLQKIPLVINYDLPVTNEQYLQRVGRSEKFDKKLVVINFITQTENKMKLDIEKYYNTEISEFPVSLDKVFE